MKDGSGHLSHDGHGGHVSPPLPPRIDAKDLDISELEFALEPEVDDCLSLLISPRNEEIISSYFRAVSSFSAFDVLLEDDGIF